MASACNHYEDRYGRCVDCGMTWEQRQAPADAVTSEHMNGDA